jgi:hypothetical protein
MGPAGGEPRHRDERGANWAIIAALIETCKLNAADPQAWMTDP